MQQQSPAAPDDTDAAWRYFLLNWILIGAMAAALAAILMLTRFSIGPAGLAVAVGYGVLYAGFAHANARSPRRRDPQVMFVLGGAAQIALIVTLMTPLTFVAASLNWPLQDANLAALDRAMGLDWGAYVRFIDAHPLLAGWLNYGYTMIRWPVFAIPVILAAKGCYRRIQEFSFAFGLALIATTVISAIVPAIGVYQQIGLDPATLKHVDAAAYLYQLQDLVPTRSGALRELDLFGLGGVVAFPSFHGASAILYLWALWPIRWIRGIAIVMNGMMLAATPANGGHFFVDVFAGMAIAILAVAAARAVGRLVIARPHIGLALPPRTPSPVAAALAAE